MSNFIILLSLLAMYDFIANGIITNEEDWGLLGITPSEEEWLF